MDEHKRREMDKMNDMFGMQYSISVENQPYPVLCTLSPDGCTAHVPDFPNPHHSCTPPLSPREAPRFGGVRSLSAPVYRPAKYRPKIPAFRGFLFYHNGIYLDGISLYRQILHK